MTADLAEKPQPRWTFSRRVIISGFIFLMPTLDFLLMRCFGDFSGNLELPTKIIGVASMGFMFFPIILSLLLLGLWSNLILWIDWGWLSAFPPSLIFSGAIFSLYAFECGISLCFRKNYLYYWLIMVFVAIVSFIILEVGDMWIIE